MSPATRARAPLIALAFGVVLATRAGAPLAHAQAPAAASPPTVETRAVPGRDVKEVTARGVVHAPPHVVRAVIADVERYPAFMPYVKESRILGRDAAGALLNYQRLSFDVPFVSDRHYVIRIAEHRYRDRDGRPSYAFVWSLQEGLPPDAGRGAVRVSLNSGFWDLRPTAGLDGSTDVRYCVFSDPAGDLPRWVVGLANTEAIPKLFAAVAGEAASERYQAMPSPADGESAEPFTRTSCGDTPR